MSILYRGGLNTVVRQGVKYFGQSDIDGGIYWARIPRMTDDKVREFCRLNDLEPYSNGAGMPYGDVPSWYHKGRWTLITQRFGYDC